MKIAILGFGIEGQAAYNYWKNQGEVTICDDTQVEVPAGVSFQLGPAWQLQGFDLIVRSPGVRPDRIPEGAKTTSVMREFMAQCPAPIIGVTGTKGKGTTSTLIAQMLQEAGKTVHLGGNIGQPPLGFLGKVKPTDYVVLELSSFQLMDLNQSPQVAVCLMIVPEHLNWHSGMDEYIQAKANIFRFQNEDNTAIYNADNQYSEKLAKLSKGTKLPYLAKPGAWVDGDVIRFDQEEVCRTADVALIGPHNLENVCAAIAACYGLVADSGALKRAVQGFHGLEHRLELVGEIKGVKYYNDSFSTTPETAIAAIAAFNEPKVVILGGSSKGSDYQALASELMDTNLRQVVLMGNNTNPDHQTATPDIAEALHHQGVEAVTSLLMPGGVSMTEVVRVAAEAAKPGDVVLLSPACASFDMFNGYKQRGEQFKQAVQARAAVDQ